ncbi:MAG: hypothetical protein C4341_02790 [Armatimonadota bacterium]
MGCAQRVAGRVISRRDLCRACRIVAAGCWRGRVPHANAGGARVRLPLLRGCRRLRTPTRDPPFLVKPNGEEASRFLRRQVATPEDACDAAKAFHQRGVAVAIVSIGAAGAAMVSSEGAFFAKPPNVETVSTIGSGDSLVGAFLAALEEGRTHEEALRLGVAAGAATATTGGAEIGRCGTILSLVDQVDIKRLEQD